MRYRYLLAAVSMLVALAATRSAVAIKPFYDVYKKEYLETNANKAFVEEATKGTNGCLTCHQGKKSKKNRNAFGKELAKLLDKKKDAKDTAKISASIKKVLAMHVDPKDDKSETYLDRVKAGKWPVGTLEELTKEPKESADKK
jgi:cytochrome c2